MKPLQLAADVPQELAAVDELLQRFGRWATESRGRRRLDTVDRYYRAERSAVDAFRPEAPLRRLNAGEAAACQAAWSLLEAEQRAVLAVLYVRTTMDPEQQLRAARVDPAGSRELHLAGLRAFARLVR